MNFKLSKKELLNSLQKINRVIPTRSTLPILSCALFKTMENKLLIRGTNLEVYISVKITANNVEPGLIAIPLNALLDITNAMPEGFSDVKIADLVLTISLNESKFFICAFDMFVIKEKSGFVKSHKVLISSIRNLSRSLHNSCLFLLDYGWENSVQ